MRRGFSSSGELFHAKVVPHSISYAPRMQNDQLVAAVDLGSNSFRLEIGRLDHERIVRVDYLKETVRQGAGLDAQRNLTEEAMQRGWETLARFAERLSGFEDTQVRAVATQTLREARNRDSFIKKAEKILGFSIDVIAGREEARLIYQGVAHALGGQDDSRLVIDIGGRSTELIIGQGLTPRVLESYRVGSVAWADKYFTEGKLDTYAFDTAIIAAKAVLDEAVSQFDPSRQAWSQAYGSAGTIGAVADILHAQGGVEGLIDSKGLAWLRAQLQAAGHVSKLELPGLKEDRKSVIGGGLAIMIALFDLLNLKQLQAVDAGLRHGVLYDLLDRDSVASDVRSQSVELLARRFAVDNAQAQRVGIAAQSLFDQIAGSVEDSRESQQRHRIKLGWAAQLHEVGALISHTDCHKHSAYIVENADVEGFSNNQLHRLSLLVLGHRGKLGKLLKEEAHFEDVRFVQQLMCLRLAMLLCHARVAPSLKGLQLQCERDESLFTLSLPAGWSEKFPQSMHLLQQETVAWSKTPWKIQVLER
jgi:exopolyphosphatase / guanosine-5'-triphosphate,3'-diphosphate pyrophosphatase